MNQKNLQTVLRRFVPGALLSWKTIRFGADYAFGRQELDNILQYLLAQNIIEPVTLTADADLETLQGYRLKISAEQQQKFLLL